LNDGYRTELAGLTQNPKKLSQQWKCSPKNYVYYRKSDKEPKIHKEESTPRAFKTIRLKLSFKTRPNVAVVMTTDC
jgi:hypothetical protein